MVLSWMNAFLVFNLLSPLEDLFGFGGVMYFFAMNSILGALFVIFYIPETMGKSFDEIAQIMQR